MSAPRELPLHGVAVYNPELFSKQELIAHFIARGPLFERLMEDLRRDRAAQHHLLIGQRGMGKTTLLRRLRYGIEDDAELRARWLPLTFPEEQYNVVRLSDFYLNCIDALGDALEQLGRDREAQALDAAVAALPEQDEPDRAQRALDLLLSCAKRLGRRLLLLVDNVELILNRLEGSQWALRELLSTESRLLLIGASAAPIEATYKYEKPFYDFFQIHELKGLIETETREVLTNLSRSGNAPAVERLLHDDPARIQTLHVLAGGNPRTIVLLYGVLAQGTQGDVRSDLERLLDLSTPLYKARFEALAAQSQQIVHALAIHWDPISAGELAEIVRLDTNVVSSQLNRLAQQGVVEKVAYHPASKTGFQIAERFFNIWYLMRASRRGRQRLLWLVEFLRLWHGGERLEQDAARHPWSRLALVRHLLGKSDQETEAAARQAVALAPAEHQSALTLAVVLTHRRKWPEAASIAERFLTTASVEVHEAAWGLLLLLFAAASQAGHSDEAAALLDASNLTDRFRPLQEALRAIADGTGDRLHRLAPEIRQPTEQLIAYLLPEGLGGPPLPLAPSPETKTDAAAPTPRKAADTPAKTAAPAGVAMKGERPAGAPPRSAAGAQKGHGAKRRGPAPV